MQDKPQWSFFPWVFFPISSPNTEHIITKNINPIKFQFPSSIDTLNNNIQKTILLSSSNNSKTINVPALINLESLKIQPNQDQFNEKNKITSVLLEGVFNSVFNNRISNVVKNDTNIDFYSQSIKNKMIVISDNHFIYNQFSNGEALPLGFDKHTRQSYGNREFIINCIDYLFNKEAYIHIRSKKLILRLINKSKAKKDKRYWQIINLLFPILIISFMGLIFLTHRRKKYN